MVEWILGRMVERAIPGDVEGPAEQRIAEVAAESAIRQAVRVLGIVGAALVTLAMLLYAFLPRWQGSPETSLPSEVVARIVTNEATLRQAAEDSERKFQQVRIERDALQATVTDLVARLRGQAEPQPTAANAAVSPDPAERERLQGRIGTLERQVADLTQKLAAANAAAVAARSTHTPEPAPPSDPPTGGSPTLPRLGSTRGIWPHPAPGDGSGLSVGPDVR